MENAGTKLVDTIRQLLNTYGTDLLKDTRRMNALLMDCMPQNVRERKLIAAVLEEGTGSRLLAAVSGSEQEQSLCVRRCRRQLEDDTWLSAEAAGFAVNVLAEALGMRTVPGVETERPAAAVRPLMPEQREFSKGMYSGTGIDLTQALRGYSIIGYKAFAANIELEEAHIPAEVRLIRPKAFINCTGLKRVQLPAAAEGIGYEVFRGCDALEEIAPGSNANYVVSGGMLINKGNKALMRAENRTKEVLQIPGAVEVINSRALERCPVKRVILPMRLKKLENKAVYECTLLEAFDIDRRNESFSVVDGILHSRDRSRLIQYPCGNRSVSYIIEDSVTEILPSAFSGSVYLENLTLTSGLQAIGSRAFENCRRLTLLMVPSNVHSIGERAFQYCERLESIILPRSMEEIGDYAFNGCVSLKTLNIPRAVRRIGHFAFYECRALSGIVIQDEVKFIGSGAFEGCPQNLEVSIRDNPYAEAYCKAHGISFKRI